MRRDICLFNASWVRVLTPLVCSSQEAAGQSLKPTMKGIIQRRIAPVATVCQAQLPWSKFDKPAVPWS